MHYRYELERLQKQNGTNGNLRVTIYKNKKELFEGWDIEELDYLNDDTPIYEIDINNGLPSYYDNPKEAYDSI